MIIDDSVCRVCLSASGNVNIFDGNGKDDQFRFCTSLEVQKDDGLPPKLCEKCNKHLRIAYDFRFQAIYTDKYFRTTIFLPSLHHQKEVDSIRTNENGSNSIELDENMQEIEKLLTDDTQILCGNIQKENNSKKSLNGHIEDSTFLTNDAEGSVSVSEDSSKKENFQFTVEFENKEKCETEQSKGCTNPNSEPYLFVQPPTFSSQSLSDNVSTQLLEAPSTSNVIRGHCLDNEPINTFSTHKINQTIPEYDTHFEKCKLLQDNQHSEQVQYSSIIEENELIAFPTQLAVEKNIVNTMNSSTTDTVVIKTTSEQNKDLLNAAKAKRKTENWKLNKESIECNVCGAVFTHINSLKTHLLKHSGEKPFKCEYCQKAFARRTVLNIHRRLHTGERPYQCRANTCTMAFVTKEALSRHMQKDHEEGKHFRKDKLAYICSVCNKSRCSKYSLASHMRTHTEEVQRKGKRKRNLTDSWSISHNMRVPLKYCKVCQKGFPNKWELSAHAELHSLNKIFECDICSTKFDKKFQLLYHLQTHDGGDEIIRKKVRKKTEIRAADCDDMSESNNKDDESLLIQCKRRGRPKGNKAKVKKESSSSEEDVGMHNSHGNSKKMIKGSDSSNDPFKRRRENLKGLRDGNHVKCHICEAHFTHSTSLKTHMLVHSGERPFKCEDCGKAFARKTVLNIHRRLHTGEKPYSCPLCPTSSVTKEALMRHMTKDHDDGSGTDARKFMCAICNKFMSSKYSFQTHMKLHEQQQNSNRDGEDGQDFHSKDDYSQHMKNHVENHKYFQCDICQATFEKKFKLLFHLQTHKLEDLPCKKCGEKFSIKEDLIQHIRTHFDKRNLDFQCPECNIGLYDMRDLKLHMQNCHDILMPNLNACDICSNSFFTSAQYYKHMYEKHDVISKTCSECDKYFDSRKTFDKHILTHFM